MKSEHCTRRHSISPCWPQKRRVPPASQPAPTKRIARVPRPVLPVAAGCRDQVSPALKRLGSPLFGPILAIFGPIGAFLGPVWISIEPRWLSSIRANERRAVTLSISLTPELAAEIGSRVESGLYTSASELLREALRLLIRADRIREAQPQRHDGDSLVGFVNCAPLRPKGKRALEESREGFGTPVPSAPVILTVWPSGPAHACRNGRRRSEWLPSDMPKPFTFKGLPTENSRGTGFAD